MSKSSLLNRDSKEQGQINELVDEKTTCMDGESASSTPSAEFFEPNVLQPSIILFILDRGTRAFEYRLRHDGLRLILTLVISD